MTFFHTQGWGDREVMAEVQRRQPTWREIELGFSPLSPPHVTPSFRRET